jgi:hypothetical protein
MPDVLLSVSFSPLLTLATWTLLALLVLTRLPAWGVFWVGGVGPHQSKTPSPRRREKGGRSSR